jgi:hypothetical protein
MAKPTNESIQDHGPLLDDEIIKGLTTIHNFQDISIQIKYLFGGMACVYFR